MVLVRHSSRCLWLVIIFLLVACSTQPSRNLVSVSSGPGSTVARHQLPEVANDWLEQARAARQVQEFMEAERLLQKVQRMAPSAAELYLEWGHLSAAKNQTGRAEQFYRRAMSLVAQNTSIYREANASLMQLQP